MEYKINKIKKKNPATLVKKILITFGGFYEKNMK